MRRLLTLLLVLCAACSVALAGNLIDSYRYASAPAPSYLLHQNFEGTGYDNSETWTPSGTVDPDSTAVVLRGSQSLAITTGTTGSVGIAISAKSELWGHFLVQIPDSTPTAELYLLYMTGASGAQIHSIRVRTTGVWRTAHNGILVNSVSAGNLADNTPFRVWWHWKAETVDGAADGVFEVWTSSTAQTSRASGTQVISQTNGTGESSVDTFSVRATPSNTMTVYFDQVIVSDTALTSVSS